MTSFIKKPKDIKNMDAPPWEVTPNDIVLPKNKKKKTTTSFSNSNSDAKFLTVYTDGSFCPMTNTGGWGVWMRDEIMAREFSGGIKKAADSAAMEYLAAFRGLQNAIEILEERKESRIIVLVTDFQELQHVFSNVIYKKGKKPSTQRIADHQNMLLGHLNKLSKLDSLLRVKKVKAHDSNDGSRSWANKKVDKLAKEEMLKLRKIAQT